MNQLKTPQAFVRRFDAVRVRLFQVQMARMAIRSLLLAVLGLALLAGIDYLWEVSATIREVGLIGMVGSVLLLAAYSIAAAVRESNRPRTAFEIERHFPELGQSVRTAVQFGGQSRQDIAADGARATLVDALEEQVDTETETLPIEAIVPTGKMKAALAVVLFVCAALDILYVGDSEWNTAAHRALLDDRPYTRMEVTPGTTKIELSKGFTVGIDLTGRTARKVTLFTRNSDDPEADWQEQLVTAEDLKQPSERSRASYEVKLAKIVEPFTYRVSVGNLMSDEYQVGLRYPLRLEKVEVELTPPAYTRTETTTVSDGNVHALEGTNALFRFQLDRAPAWAKLVLSDPRDRLAPPGEDEQPPQEIPVRIDGAVVTMQMELTQEKTYSLLAESPDEMPLPEYSFRIRIRKDQPPQVWIEQPNEALEVHTLAEVLMRIRAKDDFGLTKAGIVFQVNNEDEHTLLQKDFEAALAEAEKEAAAKGEGEKRLPLTTQAVLDKLLPLEHFEMTQKDSVTYYAFAEDNFPGGARRTETDLRFIDIRPFKRTYALMDDMPGGTPMGKPLPLLDELIMRQRFALNRSMQIAKRFASAALSGSPSVDMSAVDNLIDFQQKLAASTHELAEALLERQIAGNDLFFKAEESMLAAVDSLSAGKYDNAVLQERDALRYLIEGRDTVAFAIPKKPRKTQAELTAMQRKMLQKLRRPKNDEEAEEVASRLRQLADQEQMIAMALGGGEAEPNDDEPAPGSGGKGRASQPAKKSEKPAESPKPADSDKPADAQQDKPKSEGDNQKPESDEGADKSESGKSREMNRDEIVQKQADAVVEAADIQKAIEKINGISDLAKSRIAEGLKTAERASGSLERGDSKDAADAAGKASDMFRELARNVEGLAAAETSQKIATARNLAEELSQTERDFAGAVEKQQQQDQQANPGSGGEKGEGKEGKSGGPNDQKAEKLASRAGKIAEAGKTLEDILKGIGRSNEPADLEAVRQVQDLMQQGKLGETVKQLEGQGPGVRAGKLREVGEAAREIADRFEGTSQKLESLHRSIVAPRIAELMEIERQAVELQEKLDRLETQSQINGWHRAADELLDQLDKQGIAEESREKLVEAMKEAGWSPDRVAGNWDWALRSGRYGAPLVYHRTVRNMVGDLHAIIQELILGDLQGAADENIPPQYERLVERYYQVLSSEK